MTIDISPVVAMTGVMILCAIALFFFMLVKKFSNSA
jgi:hypothetical protein